MSDMAGVLSGHRAWATTNPDGKWIVICVECKADLGKYDDIVKRGDDRSSYGQMDDALAAHQAEMLTAAGFGPVREQAATLAAVLHLANESGRRGWHVSPAAIRAALETS